MTKRYAFTALFAVVGMVILIIFYTYVNRTVSAYEKITIGTVAGDEDVINDVTLSGILYSNGTNNAISISKENTDVYSQSMLNMNSAFYYMNSAAEIRLKELQQEYRSFMRGKDKVNRFYEDEHFLLYGELIASEINEKVNWSAQISFYDKAKAEEWDFTVALPLDFEIKEPVDIYDVQMHGQEVILILAAEQNDSQSIWRISVNASQKKLTDSSLIYSLDKGLSTSEEGEHQQNYLNMNEGLTVSAWMTKAKYIPFSLSTSTREENGDETKIGHQFFVINIESGELSEVKLAEQAIIDSDVFVDHENIYYLEKQTGAVNKYHVEDGSSEFILQHDALMNYNYDHLLEFSNDKLYLLANGRYTGEGLKNKVIDFYVLDLNNGKEMYHGKIDYNEFVNGYIDFSAIYPKRFD